MGEFTGPAAVIDGEGRPCNAGWACFPAFVYDPRLLRSPLRNIAACDRYIFFSPTHLVILEIRDDGYLGYAGLSLVALREKKRVTQTYTIPLSLGSLGLPAASESGSIKLKTHGAIFEFVSMGAGVRLIRIDMPHFGHHRSLRGEVVLSPAPGAQAIAANMGWRQAKHAFRYMLHSPGYTVEGVIQAGGAEVVFTRGNSWGIFEWGRGSRPRRDVRWWASAAGLAHHHLAALNVGYDSADSREGTENAFFLDGTLHKLDTVTFHIPPSDWLLPWHFTSNDNRLEMTFTPHQIRSERYRFLWYSRKRRQICGFFSGRVILDSGDAFHFKNLTGFAEQVKTRR
ncbi:MAG: DUF2804 domain-containing protein [Treponema sp.]|jgi:hypothetical protein|nr:DUF2804 domain-containing protein [Treponema sp.]